MNPFSAPAPAPTRAAGVLPTALLLLAAPAAAQAANPDPVATTRATLEQWVATKSLVSKEKRDWDEAKNAMQARMDLLKRDIVALQKRTAEAQSSLAQAETKRRELQTENDVEKETASGLEQRIAGLEQRLLATLPRLPEPLRDKVKSFTQRIPAKDAPVPPTLSLGDRYATVVVVLNEIHKWNREIAVTSEVRAQPDGSNVEVTVLYAGVGQAWYVSGSGKVAGVGAASADGWVWRPANELAADIQRVVAVWKNEQPAAFVPLPVQVQ
jgi:Skp family chaperone for outer membrane proteins